MSDHKIPPRLIIYKASRFSLLRQNNLKYSNFSPHFQYSESQSSRGLQKRILDLPKKHYINKISHSLSPSQFENDYFLKFITRSLNFLRYLSLTLAQQESDSQLSTRKTLKKILKTCSRAKSLDLVLSATSAAQTQLSWKLLSLIKSFKNFTCTLSSSHETHFENLAHTLAKTQRNCCSKRANSFHFIIDSTFDAENDRGFNWIPFANALEKINSNLKNSHFSLDIGFGPQVEIKDFLGFAQRSFSLPSFRELSLDLDFFDYESSLRILGMLEKSKSLEKLSLTPKDSFSYDRTTSLPQNINLPKFKSLSHLHLNFEKLDDSHFLSGLFKGLTQCNTQLSSLSVHPGIAAPLVLAYLTQTLDKFDELSILTLNAHFQPRFNNSLTAETIKPFCEKLCLLKRLKKLDLSFAGQIEACSEDVFSSFCQSLKSLKELKSLRLDLNSSWLTDDCLIQLSNVLPNLDTLELDCQGMNLELTSGKIIKELIANLVGLKNLSHLELKMLCECIDDQYANEIVASFWELKSLSYLRFDLASFSSDFDAVNLLRKQMRTLEKNIDVFFSTSSP